MGSRPKWRRLMCRLAWEDKAPFASLSGYAPHSGQLPIHASRSQYRVVCCGRRFGKSQLAAFEAAVCASMGGLAWAVAPTYELASVVYDFALSIFARPDMARLVSGTPSTAKGSQVLRTVTGGAIVAKSSDNPKSLLGRGPDLVVFDEAALEDDPDVWQQHLRPALLDSEGALLAISTPRGSNWFKDAFDQAAVGTPGWECWRMPSGSNPLLSASALEEIVRELPESTIQQEIEAEFMAGAGAVFRKVREAAVGDWQDGPAPGRSYVMGVDIAQFEDWTVAAVADAEDGRIVHVDRWNQVDWRQQVERLARLSELFGASVLIDATSNSAVWEALRDRCWWTRVEPFVFTAQSKAQVVNQYALMLERSEAVLPALGSHAMAVRTVLELESYRYERTAAGTLKMSAPSGKHDDVVIAVVLANELARRHTGERPAVGPLLGRQGGVALRPLGLASSRLRG